MGSFIIGIVLSFSLLNVISRLTNTAVSVASCNYPKCLILLKCCLIGAGRSRGGWSPKTPQKMR